MVMTLRDWQARLFSNGRVSFLVLRTCVYHLPQILEILTVQFARTHLAMAADPITADAAAELLNYDVSDDDPFNDNLPNQTRDDKATLSPRGTKRKTAVEDNGGSLGLDEEVKIAKKRKPMVKLDEDRYVPSSLLA